VNGASFLINTSWGARSVLARVTQILAALPFVGSERYRLTIEKVEPRGTEGQRRRIRAIVGEIAEQTGNDAGHLYEQLLELRFGLDELEMPDGSVTARPAKRVSDMNWQQRSDYIDWLQAIAADVGVELRQ